jgi:6-phosphogluconolactonase (cycloisomerase 2 family)
MPRRSIIPATLAALAIAAPAAHAAGSPAGSMTVRACIGHAAVTGCTVTPLADSIEQVAVAPNGATVYSIGEDSSNNDILAAWAVDRATGTLTLRNCISDSFQAPCTTNNDFYQLSKIVVSIHGVYVKGSGNVVHVPVLSDGSLGTADSCVSTAVCNDGDTFGGLQGLRDIAVTPDGRTLVVAAVDVNHGSLSLFGLDPTTGEIGGRLICATADPTLPMGCTSVPGLRSVSAVAATDSAYYVASNDPTYAGVYAFGRDTITGSLSSTTVTSCVQEVTAGALGCFGGRGIDSIFRLTMSPDQHSLYAISPENATQGYVVRLQISISAHIAAELDCLGLPAIGGCTGLAGLAAPNEVAVSSDSQQIYVVSTANNHDGEITAYGLNTVSGSFTPKPVDCIGSTATLCTGSVGRSFTGLDGIDGVALDPVDGHELFVGGRSPDHAAPDGTLVTLSREVAPSCATANVTTTVGVPVLISGCADANSDPLSYLTSTAPLDGQASPALGGLLYTPGAGFIGVDAFQFSATDGSLQAAAATATVTVDQAPPPPTQTTTTTTRVPPPPPDSDAKPKVSIATPNARPTSIHGTASDDHRVKKVQVAIAQTLAHHRCRSLASSGHLAHRAACTARHYLTAKGTTRWALKLRHSLPAGSYTIYARATDSAGQTTTAHRSLRVGGRR